MKSYSTVLEVSRVLFTICILTLKISFTFTYFISASLHSIVSFITNSLRHFTFTLLFIAGLIWHCSIFNYLYINSVFCYPVLADLKAVVKGFLQVGHLRVFFVCNVRFWGSFTSPSNYQLGSSRPPLLTKISHAFYI